MTEQGQIKTEKIVRRKENILKPEFCCVAATDYCMLRCKMCNKWSEPSPKPGEAPTIDEWKRFISGFRELVDEGFEMDFGGGEALSMPGILDLVKHAKQLGFRTTMASNGYLINGDMAKRIRDAGLDAVSLSLDSHNPEIHDKMRGVKGVHKQVVNAIDNLTRYAPQTKKGLCCIIMNENLDEILKLVDWADRNKKVDWIYFMVVVQPNYSGPLTDNWLDEYQYLWPKDRSKVLGILDELIRRRKSGSKVSNRVEHLRAYKAYFNNPQKLVNKAKCIVGGKAISVNAYGFVQLCLFKDFIGNIRKDDIRELWRSQDADLIRKKVDECKTNCHLLLNCCYIEDEPTLYAD
ncbi:MAG: radical SAM protein [Candidatus Omnitrophica bacterium]|nr:radical SAM protein [Candidatus Omnitrophota bacterium]MBU4149979.1 radical SAM protein [Candidatus Omnitrophota bacterium]